MGIISLIFIAVILTVLLLNFKQKLDRCKRDYQESFVALRIALACRHQAVRHVLDASKISLGREDDNVDSNLLSSCGDAEAVLTQASKSFSPESLSRLCNAEASLNNSLRALQEVLEKSLKQRPDQGLKSQLEMLDAAETDVVSARRAYNRSAERYNRMLRKTMSGLVAKVLGYHAKASLIKFEDNSVPQMSKHLMA